MRGLKTILSTTALFAGLAFAPARPRKLCQHRGSTVCAYGYTTMRRTPARPMAFTALATSIRDFLGMGHGPAGVMGTAGAGIASVTAVEEAIAAAAAPWPIAVIMPRRRRWCGVRAAGGAASMSAQAVGGHAQPYVRTHPRCSCESFRGRASSAAHAAPAHSSGGGGHAGGGGGVMPLAAAVVDMPAAAVVVVDMPAAVAAWTQITDSC